MILVGLTGGIGSGKSTVSALLGQRGAVIIDADAIVHELQEPGQPVFDAIVEEFGPGVVGADRALDRAALAAIVFADADRLAALNGIVHPSVGAEIARRMVEEAQGDHVVILDVPLLVESGRNDMAGMLVVDVDPEVAVARVVEFRGMDADDVRARMARQVSRSDRLEKADFVIDNSGDLDELQAHVDRAWAWIETLPSAPEPESDAGDS
ncbi:MAG: dephospho-CoA kinase [Acidimicrobiales bacterium]